MRDCVPWRGVQLQPFDSDAGDVRDPRLKRRRGASLVQVTDDGRLLLFGGRHVDTDVYVPDAYGIDFTDFAASDDDVVRYLPLTFTCDEDEQDPDVAAVTSAKVLNRIRLGGRAAKGSFHSQTTALHESSVYVYGGYASPAPLLQKHAARRVLPLPYWDQHFFELNLVTLKWHQVKSMPHGDPRRRGHTAVVYHDAMYVYGGWGPQADWWRNDTDCYNFKSRAWTVVEPTSITPPPRVACHSATLRGSVMYVFGGYIDESPLFVNSVMGLEDSVHHDAESETASLKHGGHASTAGDTDADDGPDVALGARPEIVALNNNSKTELISRVDAKRVMEGAKGEAGPVQFLSNAVFTLDLATGKWQRRTAAGDVPAGRACHSANFFEDSLIVVGGEGCRSQSHQDIHVLDTNLMLWTAVKPPPQHPIPCLSGHAALVLEDNLVIVGGGACSSYHLCFGGLADVDAKSPSPQQRAQGMPADDASGAEAGTTPQGKGGDATPRACDCIALPLPELLRAAAKRKAAAKREIAARCDLPVNTRNHPREVIPKQRHPRAVQAIVSRLTARPRDFDAGTTFRETATSRSDDRIYAKPQTAAASPPSVNQDELLERLYGRVKTQQEARQRTLEGRYLKPVVLEKYSAQKSPNEIGKITQALCDDSVRNRQNVHTALLNNRLTTWQGIGKEGKWVTSDWQAEQAKALAKISPKDGRSAGEMPPRLTPMEEDMVKRFYTDRKACNERQVKANESAFKKHNPQRKAAKKLEKDDIVKANERFYGKPMKDRAHRKPFVDPLETPCKKRTDAEWNETVLRLTGSP